MTGRERVLRAMSHKEPDHVPVELGSTWNSTITLSSHQELSEYYGGGYDKYRLMRWVDSLVFPDSDLLDILSVDCRSIYNKPGKERTMEEMYRQVGLKELPDGALALLDDRGRILQMKPQGSEEFQEKEPPIEDLCDREEVERCFCSGVDSEFRDMVQDTAENARRIREENHYAVIQSNFIAMPVTQVQQAIGFENWYLSLLLNEKELLYATEKYLEMRLEQYEVYFSAIGPYLDVTECVGDDMADQRGPSFRLETYRKIFKPMHKRIIETVKKYTDAKIMFHICGAAAEFLPDLIDIGVEIINPVQPAAAGMDFKKLKQEFGRDLTFWGGIDTQHILPFGTPEQVKEHVKEVVTVMSKDGGYIFAPSHDILRGTPVENIAAMYETVKEYF